MDILEELKMRAEQMIVLIIISLSLDISRGITDYRQKRELLPQGRLELSWEVREERIFFKIIARGSRSVSFLFSYNDVPTDGFQAGIADNDEPFLSDLHLDFAGWQSVRYLNKMNYLFVYLL